MNIATSTLTIGTEPKHIASNNIHRIIFPIQHTDFLYGHITKTAESCANRFGEKHTFPQYRNGEISEVASR